MRDKTTYVGTSVEYAGGVLAGFYCSKLHIEPFWTNSAGVVFKEAISTVMKQQSLLTNTESNWPSFHDTSGHAPGLIRVHSHM
jgi:hypothetical protein